MAAVIYSSVKSGKTGILSVVADSVIIPAAWVNVVDILSAVGRHSFAADTAERRAGASESVKLGIGVERISCYLILRKKWNIVVKNEIRL